MNPSRKLKRGLEDLSPLFQGGRKPEVVDMPRMPEEREAVPTGHILAVCRGDGSNFSAAPLLAGMLFPQEKDALLLTITDGVNTPPVTQPRGGLFRCPLSWTEFRKLCTKNETAPGSILPMARNVVLDFDLRTGFPEEVIVPLVDKCLFWIQPEFENLAEVYKLIKAAKALNPGLDCYLVYEGEARDNRGEFVFEKLSQLCSERLSLDMTWLGSAWVDDETGEIVCDLRLEHLWFKSVDRSLLPEKIQLLRFAAALPAGGTF